MTKLLDEIMAAVLDEVWSPDLEGYNEASKAAVKQKARAIAVRVLTVVNQRETCEPIGCPTPGACSCPKQ